MNQSDIEPCCGTCKKSEMGKYGCSAGHELKYPLITCKHECADFEYEPKGEEVFLTPFNQANLTECESCAHELNGVCDGKRWIPFKRNPYCEFFRSRGLTCKHAIPFIQYGNGHRNNKCALPPERRKTDAKRSKDCCCPNAHRSSHMECHEPIRETINA